MMYRVLLDELLALKAALNPFGLPLMIGGGMGLYLRETYHPHKRQPRYPVPLPVRSTQDLDVFLSAEVIVDREAMEQIRDCIADLGYKPHEPFFQFIKAVKIGGREGQVKIDLLAAPPREDDLGAVKLNAHRIRPKKAKNIHAYYTEEARGIHRGRLAIDLRKAEEAQDMEDAVVFVPSSYNYLILKLHAFDDRKDREDAQSDRGRHHALDIFRVVIDMTEEDWQQAEVHYAAESEARYLQSACEIRKRCFSQDTAIGMLRLRENVAYIERRDEYDDYLSLVIDDLARLLP